jgi:hypothetical protein
VQKHWDNATYEERALECLRRLAKPVFLGTIAVELGQSLKRTLKVVKGMEQAGAVRYLTLDEKRTLGVDASSVLCVLVDS